MNTFQPFFANAATAAFDRATTETRITLLVLLALSCFAWAVILAKLIQFWSVAAGDKRFRKAAAAAPHGLQGALDSGEPFGASVLAQMCRYALAAPEPTPQQAALSPGRVLSRARFAITCAAHDLEAGLELLAMAVSAGPLLGLFGTVWGVMETFCGLANANAVSLKTMAPGVAGSLIATVCGLAVAIPAQVSLTFLLFWLHRLQTRIDWFLTCEFTPAVRSGVLTSPAAGPQDAPEEPSPDIPPEAVAHPQGTTEDAASLPGTAALPEQVAQAFANADTTTQEQ